MSLSGPHVGTPPPLAIIGGGNMGMAIVRGGMAARGVVSRAAVVVAEPDGAKRSAMGALGVRVVKSGAEAMRELVLAEERTTGAGTGQVVLAVKPQMLAGLAEEIRPLLAPVSRVVISILAGTPTEKVRGLLGDRVRVVRAMPNLPAQIGRGVTAVCRGAGSREGDDAVARELFGDVGRLVVTIDESLMDAFTAVAGSGPAYVFYLAEAMVKAAVDLGFDDETAAAIVRETVAGSGELLGRSDQTPEMLRRAVTSKGGTTEAAGRVLDEARVQDSITRAIAAARDRGRTLGG